MKPILKKITLSLAAISVLFFMQSCKEDTIPADNRCLDEAFVAQLTFHTAAYEPVRKVLRLPGKVSYNTEKVVQYVPLVSGVVKKTHFSLGDFVQKGQVLAEIHSSDLLELSNSYKAAKLELAIAKRNYDAVNRQFDDGFASERELMVASREKEMAGNTLEKYKSLLELYDGDAESGRFLLKSPAHGYIVENKMSIGTQIYPESDPVFTVSDLSEIWVVANIYSGIINRVRHGMDAEIVATAYRDTVFRGKVSHVSNVFDADKRVLQARIVLKNDGLMLKPGMFVDISIFDENGQEMAIAVPERAIIFENSKKHVVVYHDACHVEVREVDELATIGSRTYIKHGISENETLVVENALYLFHRHKK